MSKIENELPEKAELTGEVEEIKCDNCFEEFIFSLKQGEHAFTIGLLDILDCLRFAEKQGAVPKLPSDWWIDTDIHYWRE